MMNNAYDDYTHGTFVPDVVITKRADNGHFTASAMGLSVTHYDQSEAVNRLTNKIQDAITTGEIHPQG